VYRLPPERVWVSVYEDDDEALAIWRDVVGVDPARIRKMGAADNFWASGPTGGGGGWGEMCGCHALCLCVCVSQP
jgi:alanyl-tRNA synthetase